MLELSRDASVGEPLLVSDRTPRRPTTRHSRRALRTSVERLLVRAFLPPVQAAFAAHACVVPACI
jgi:hypothetical protein